MALPMLERRFDAAAYLAWEETQEDVENRWVLYDYGPEDQVELASLGLHLPVEAVLEGTREDFAVETPTATAQP